jgi:hypothetical protein
MDSGEITGIVAVGFLFLLAAFGTGSLMKTVHSGGASKQKTRRRRR